MTTKTQGKSELLGLLDDFLAYLEITKNRSRLTIRNYRFYLRRFFRVMDVRRPAHVTAETVKRYRLLLNRWTDAHGRGLGKLTQNYHLIALRAFLKYLAKEGVQTLPAEKVELAKLPDRQVAFLDSEEIEELLRQPFAHQAPEIIQYRDRALLEVLFSTGMRVSELVALQRGQVGQKSDELSIRGKGGRVRVVFLSMDARRWIADYLKRRLDNSPSLFVRHDRAGKDAIAEEGKPLTPRSVQRLIARYATLAGITKTVTPHTMRHSYATDLLVNGADIRSVQAILGHASITTTQIYTHVTNKQLRDVHQAFHARRRRKGS